MRLLPMYLLLAAAAVVTAAPTLFTDVYEFNGLKGAVQDPGKLFPNTVRWAHGMPYSGDVSNIIAASLTIEGSGIDNIRGNRDGDGRFEKKDKITVFLNNRRLGTLTGNSTTFTLDPDLFKDIMEASATLRFRFDKDTLANWRLPFDRVRLSRSTLDVAVVPAPGALLLCGLGSLVAGHLKRRRSL